MTSPDTFFDALETRDPQLREQALLAALPAQIAHAQANTRAYAEILAGVAASSIDSRAALARLPVIRKSELLARQQAQRAEDPFGGFAAIGWTGLLRASGARRVFQSPGTIYEPEADGEGPDYWRVARALHAAGMRAGDLLHNGFSYHLTPAGAMMEGGAHALGLTVFPGGVGNTELQLQAMVELRPQGFVGTPSFLKILLDKAAESAADVGSLRKALFSGEAFTPSLRDWFAARGVQGFQCYATADLGLIAYETAAREGLVLAEGVIVEIVRPGTGEPLPDGEVGELVVTTLTPGYPLIRFGTGDLSAFMPGSCPTGRSNRRIRGWLGRADQSAKVRGMFVHAGQVAEALRRFPGLGRARLVVEGEMAQDRMCLKVELAGAAPEGLAEGLAQAMREITKLRCEVLLLPAGSLPNDGKVIEDARSYQ
ncbi:phenylacetate-CoA ligase [Paucibacter oligotrophus]|uniref:Phenylacetate-CoA ligase n=1 Tax=Roseateles oligotrophus TaxID=1769250 RepID=A0A840L3G5_9BURK|nr:AMP-binding protein [Roseateles oligotrophus]MBB4842361.1 phenylacetate-CoA ligase [Roseateles oligotrophus]